VAAATSVRLKPEPWRKPKAASRPPARQLP
jgi:hypothetical protein